MSPEPARREARAILEQTLSRGGLSGDLDNASSSRDSLLAILNDETARDYLRLDAACALALEGDARAIPILRRVFTTPGFAVTNSLDEGACAALALALLGDDAMLPRIRRLPAINLLRDAIPLALALLDRA